MSQDAFVVRSLCWDERFWQGQHCLDDCNCLAGDYGYCKSPIGIRNCWARWLHKWTSPVMSTQAPALLQIACSCLRNTCVYNIWTDDIDWIRCYWNTCAYCGCSRRRPGSVQLEGSPYRRQVDGIGDCFTAAMICAYYLLYRQVLWTCEGIAVPWWIGFPHPFPSFRTLHVSFGQ